VSALASCPSQARGCETATDADEDEEPKTKRQCCSSTDAADLDGNTPAAIKDEGADSDGEGAADVKLRQVLASAEVAKSTNLKRARNVSWILARMLTFVADLVSGVIFLVHPVCS
jgi:hypothetical protein